MKFGWCPAGRIIRTDHVHRSDWCPAGFLRDAGRAAAPPAAALPGVPILFLCSQLWKYQFAPICVASPFASELAIPVQSVFRTPPTRQSLTAWRTKSGTLPPRRVA